MEIPSKIFIRPSENPSFPKTELDFITVAHTKKKDNDFEYINLDDKWHNVLDSYPIVNRITASDPVIVRCGNGSVIVCTSPYDYTLAFELAEKCKNSEKSVWAWLNFLIPKDKQLI